MVVIEPDEVEEIVANPPNPKAAASSSKTTTDSNDCASSTAPRESGNDSDGFETASERDVSDYEEDNDVGSNKTTTEDHHQQQQQEGKGDSREDSSHDYESEQNALAQANDSKLEGNKLFGDGRYEEALIQYEVALRVAPDIPSSAELRSACHSNRAVCFFKLEKYEDTTKECTKALELNPSYMKALIRRGEAHEKLENFEEAIADMKKILELDPSNDQARRAIHRLEPLAAEKREKMKEEMIGKLKDMGNSVLGRFGMSIDNFKAVKDPNTGSYSISFQR